MSHEPRSPRPRPADRAAHRAATAWLGICTLMLGCSSPTLEEACAEFCDQIVAAGCDSPTAKECSDECAGLRDQLDGKCVEEYTDTLVCGAGLDYECRDGRAVATDASCLEEAIELLSCSGFITSTESGDSASADATSSQ